MTEYSSENIVCSVLAWYSCYPEKITVQRQKTVSPIKLHGFHRSAAVATIPCQNTVVYLGPPACVLACFWHPRYCIGIVGSRIFLDGGDFGNSSERRQQALCGSGLTGE